MANGDWLTPHFNGLGCLFEITREDAHTLGIGWRTQWLCDEIGRDFDFTVDHGWG